MILDFNLFANQIWSQNWTICYKLGTDGTAVFLNLYSIQENETDFISDSPLCSKYGIFSVLLLYFFPTYKDSFLESKNRNNNNICATDSLGTFFLNRFNLLCLVSFHFWPRAHLDAILMLLYCFLWLLTERISELFWILKGTSFVSFDRTKFFWFEFPKEVGFWQNISSAKKSF